MDKELLCLLLLLYSKGVVSSTCETHKTCAECIQDPSVCKWCAALNVNQSRCMASNADASWCGKAYIENPTSSSAPIENEDFSSKSGALVQMKPQKHRLYLRPGLPIDFEFSFQAVQDYPVDLYFLFDASTTMGKLRNHTAKQAGNIYRTMLSMTNDVYMGLGSFVDKNTLPYAVDIVSKKSYSFKNHMVLSSDLSKFQEEVNNIPHGKNRDSPEGTLDALAQAIVCKDQIKWRDESRKIIVLLTDGPYHAAGDGRAGGIFTPYDGECHTEHGVYTKQLEMDYPSVSMINKLTRDKKVIVIFGSVNSERHEAYKRLSNAVSGSKVMFVGKNENYDDMVPKLKEIYEDISRKIKLNYNIKSPGRPKHFSITFDPDCTQKNDKKFENPECVVSGREHNFIQFNATITLLQNDDYDNTEIDVTIDGIDEKMTLEVNVIKKCSCGTEVNSDHCNNNTLECGICHCTAPTFGDRCQCNKNTKTKMDSTSCIYEINNSTCNGQGTCFCGVCSCNPGFVGPYCQCLLSACPLHAGVACGGHGACQCDRTCLCRPGYSGDACQCDNTDLTACTGPGQKICNNRGKCECGKCQCDKIAPWDNRKAYDELCVIEPYPQSHNQQCESLTPCVLCLLKENLDCPCPEHNNYTIFDKLPEVSNESDWLLCKNVRVDVGCYTNYTYMYDEEVYGIRLMLQKEKDCVMGYYLYGGIGLVVLLLIGILTLIGWKLCTDYRDKQEYNKFIEDHQSEIAPCKNPLYVSAVTQFRNPSFGKRSVSYN